MGKGYLLGPLACVTKKGKSHDPLIKGYDMVCERVAKI